MTDRKGKKLEPPLHLDMSFEEMLERAAQTKPEEVREGIDRAKKKKPPGESIPERQATPDGLQRTKRKR